MTSLVRPERQAETGPVRDFYGDGGIWKTCTQGHIEGGDIHIIRPGLLAVGVSGGRTDEAGAAKFISWFEDAGWTCRMIRFPEHYLHLDVIFTMVTADLAIALVDALDSADVAWLRAQGIRLLSVTYAEAMRDMGCNVLSWAGGVWSARSTAYASTRCCAPKGYACLSLNWTSSRKVVAASTV